MLSSSLLGLDQFWSIVRSLESMGDKTSIEDFKTSNKIFAAEGIILEVISFLQKFDYHIEVEKKDDSFILHPAVDKSLVKIPFGFTDWLALQSCLVNKDNDMPFQLLRSKIKAWNEDNMSWDLFKSLEMERVEEYQRKSGEFDIKNKINLLEKAKQESCLAVITFEDGKKYETYIHNLIILDGKLSIIAEEVIDRCLVSFFVSEVTEIKHRPEHSYNPNYSTIEVEDFIAGMRSVIDNEERLVLKIYNPEKVDLNPPYHFLGSPYITSNAEGEYIWAASVEVSDELFNWLKEIKDDIQIIDPEAIKKQFELFLEQESQEIKKAS